MRFSPISTACFLALGACLTAYPAAAQDPAEFDVVVFGEPLEFRRPSIRRPVPSASAISGTQSTEIYVGDLVLQPYLLLENEVDDLNNSSFMGLVGNAALGFELGSVKTETGVGLVFYTNPQGDAGLGDLHAQVKSQLLDPTEGPVGLTIGSQFGVVIPGLTRFSDAGGNIGQLDLATLSYTNIDPNDSGTRFREYFAGAQINPGLQLDIELGPVTTTVNGGAEFLYDLTNDVDEPLAMQTERMAYGVAASFRVAGHLAQLEVSRRHSGSNLTTFDDQNPLDAYAGYRLERSNHSLELSVSFNQGNGLAVIPGISYQPVFPVLDWTLDSDNDGLANADDNCPTVANAQQLNMDADATGDACDPDIDGDQIANANDNCPTTPNPDQANIDHQGPGDACTVDGDNDTIDDMFDNCPDQDNTDQGDLDRDNLGDACDPDRDGDGVDNSMDACPNVHGLQAWEGCANRSFALYFLPLTATLKQESTAFLGPLAERLKTDPKLTGIEIAGHTDVVNSDDMKERALELSQERAEAVKAYLVEQGVNGDIITSRGYGDTRPAVVPDDLSATEWAEQRSKNRRVEFNLTFTP
ncbi:MAG: OmpA family protein [Myxococcota bacterium]